MHSERTDSSGDTPLRQRAEREVREKGRSANLSETDIRALCHELEVHQVELQMQNDELQRVHAELTASEEKYRDLYEFAPIGYLTLDSSGKILGANLASAALLGTERARLANNPFQAYLADGSISEFKAFCRRVMDSNVKQTAELQLRCAGSEGNTAACVLVEGRAIQDGINHGFRMAIIDVSKQKGAEKALQNSRDEQELKVKERTADLSKANERLEKINEKLISEIKERKRAEEELVVAKDAAESALKAKAEFLANMSHEIRTPMNSVIGFTDLLLDEPESLNPEQKGNLDAIRVNGHALLTIINDILDFSKMESDKLVLEDQTFNLRQCVEESLDLVSIKASEKGLNLSYTIDKDVPDTIIGDPGRLRQVLGNLLSNAVKFTDRGEVTVSVSSRQIDGANGVHFAVQDTGIGISRDGMNQLFQPFNQMEPSTTRLYGGTGLGLVISKKLVELMGGQVWAESKEGIGSTFHFTIKASSDRSNLEYASVSPQLIGKCALIVEDNKTNRRLLSKQIYDWGMVPMAVSSGQEALGYIQRGDHFDIAILDIDLKDMDSLELEEKIQKYNKYLPLILLTSLGKRIPPNHAYLTKPIKQSQLHRVLTEVLPKADILPKANMLQKEPVRGQIMASETDQPIQSSPLRILLAEDNVSNQMVALQMLKKLGYRADVAANGIEVLQSLERQPYDVVLMDVKMPEMDGLEATRIIRKRWSDNGPRIIAITAYALQGDRDKCLEAGMNDYIAKPIQKDDLARALKEINRL
jgi:PAS domain S-box-containing protein